MKMSRLSSTDKSGSYLPEGYGRIFLACPETSRNHNVKPVEFIPTGKGNSVFGRLSKVAPRAVFGKIILAALRYFSKKPCTA